MSRTRPLTIPAARVHRAGADWTTRRASTAWQSEQINGPLQPMEQTRPESWVRSLLCAVLVAVAFAGMVLIGGAL